MALTDPSSIVIPSWRGGRLLFFTSMTDKDFMRLDYRVAAATAPGETEVKRTFKAPLTAEQLAKCQETADNGVALQQFFHALGRGNLSDLASAADGELPPCAGGANPLLYICSYFNFLRKYSVDQALVGRYEQQNAKDRMEPESALSIYKILSAHLQPARAAKLIDADIPDINRIKGPHISVANLLREVAIIRFDTGDYPAAIATMKQAIKLQDSPDKWRWLGGFAFAAKQPEDAIEFLEKSESRAPLGPPDALRLARLLINADRNADASAFLDRAEKVFPVPVKQLRARIAT